MFYKKDNTIVNLSNSILKYYDIETFHPTLKNIDKILANSKNKKLAVILLDGFGTYIQDIYKEDIPFLYSHKVMEISATFPPTTVASTTSFLTGKYPCETGYLAWREKLPFYDTPVLTFTSRFVDSHDVSPITVNEFVPNTNIIELINNKYKKEIAHKVMSFELEYPCMEYFYKKCHESIDKYEFSYLYYTEPDSSLHKYGTKSSYIQELVGKIDKMLNDLINNHKDTTFIVIADHGHIDTTYYNIENYPDIMEILSTKYNCMEPRCTMLFIKKDKLKGARNILLKHFPKNEFKIFSKKEIIRYKIFGLGQPCPQFEDLIGDYLLVSIADKGIEDRFSENLKATHAGGTVNEEKINVAVFNS